MRVALTKTRKAKVLQLPSAINVNFSIKKIVENSPEKKSVQEYEKRIRYSKIEVSIG